MRKMYCDSEEDEMKLVIDETYYDEQNFQTSDVSSDGATVSTKDEQTSGNKDAESETANKNSYQVIKCDFTFGFGNVISCHKDENCRCKYGVNCNFSIIPSEASQDASLLHISLKNYQCLKCEQCWGWICYFSEHVIVGNRHSETSRRDSRKNKYFKCPECDFTTARRGYLRNHKRETHGKHWSCVCSELECFCKHHIPNEVKDINEDLEPSNCVNYFSPDVNFDSRKVNFVIQNVNFGIQNVNFGIRNVNIKTPLLLTPVSKSFECGGCFRVFNHKGHLTRHIKAIHRNLPLYNCNDCKFLTFTEQDLENHVSEKHSDHSKLKPLQCSDCDFSCFRRKVFEKHCFSIHGKSRPYKCSGCDYSFDQIGNFKMHVQSDHRKWPPYQCVECKSTYRSNQSLNRHVNSAHRNFKPYKCSACGYSSIRKDVLNKHIDAVHKNLRPFKCTECSYSSSRKCRLTTHVQKFH